MTTVLLRRLPFDREPSFQSRRQLHRAKLRKHLDEYRVFVLAVGNQIGELSPVSGEDVRDIRVLVRMAARDLGVTARTWIDEGKVYFYIRAGSI